MGRLSKMWFLAKAPKTWKAVASTRTVAAIEHNEVIRYFNPETVIDVGANKGQFSLAVRNLLPSTKIFAFEPLQAEAAIYERNFARNGNYKLYKYALSEEPGKATFHVAARADSSSLLALGDGQSAAYGIREACTIEVEVRRLDQVITPSMLSGRVMLKIDVQGAEDMVIRGATGILSNIDCVYLEASFVELYTGQKLAGEMITLLAELGFEWRGVGHASMTSAFGATQADLIFSRRKHSDK